MAKARMYAFNGVEPKGEFKGQAAVVLDVLKRQNGEMKLASDIAAQVAEEGKLKTRQDILRVVLYYIIVFKGKGMIATQDQEVLVAPPAAEEQPVAAE
jgi:hypothetical protein